MALLQITWPDYKQTCHAHSSLSTCPTRFATFGFFIFLFYSNSLLFVKICSYQKDYSTYIIHHISKSCTPTFPMVLVSSKIAGWSSRSAHTLCTLLHFMWHQRCRLQINSVLLKWLVEHQFLFQTCEKEMQLVLHTLLHLTNICTVCFARLLATTS